jgi:hypothetical protein
MPKYKIQTQSVNGWADLKSNEDDQPYSIELYDSVSLAMEELEDLEKLSPGEYRVVPETMPSNDELY